MRTFSRHEIYEIVLAYLNYKTENLKAENYGENRPKVQEYISLPISRFFKDLVFIKKYNSYSNNHVFFKLSQFAYYDSIALAFFLQKWK